MKNCICEKAVYIARGNGVESVHDASIAVLDASGKITHALGNPGTLTFTRSALKPFQALPLLTEGVADRIGLSEKELAICCGSHNGSDEHQHTAMSILSKGQNSPADLLCGAHWPSQLRLTNVYPLNGEDKDPTRNNCSGKHSGFLALAQHFGDNLVDYLEPNSKTQKAVRVAVAEALGVDLDKMPQGIDGCSAPNYAAPIDCLARGFLRLATASDGPFARVAKAMRAYPEMVSGDRRFDLALSRTFPDNVVCKVGAEAVEAIAFAEPALAMVIKINDGGTRALYAACVETMKQLGLLQGVDMSHLKPFERPIVKNHRGIHVGEVRAEFELEKLS
jgi:L-asparaginase II